MRSSVWSTRKSWASDSRGRYQGPYLHHWTESRISFVGGTATSPAQRNVNGYAIVLYGLKATVEINCHPLLLFEQWPELLPGLYNQDYACFYSEHLYIWYWYCPTLCNLSPTRCDRRRRKGTYEGTAFINGCMSWIKIRKL